MSIIKKKVIGIIVAVLILIAGVVAVMFSLRQNNTITAESTGNQSAITVRFADIEGDFTLPAYYDGGLPFGKHKVELVKGKTSNLSFSKEVLKVDNVQKRLNIEDNNDAVVFIVDLDAADDYYEILICEYLLDGHRANDIYRYDGKSIKEMASYGENVYFNNHGKVVVANRGFDIHLEIADPMITRLYSELRNGMLEFVKVPLEGKTFTFAQEINFKFYETAEPPTLEFIKSLFENGGDSNETYPVSDLAGKQFTILDYSSDTANDSDWYYVQLDDGQQGIIHW